MSPTPSSPVASDDFLSCDWGTSSFRLRWVSKAGRDVIHEIREPVGIRSLHDEAVRSDATGPARTELFCRFLYRRLNQLIAEGPAPTHPLPLVISGMASSSVGWLEVPYARAPFPLHGRGLRSKQWSWNKPDWLGATYILSGVATEDDMMRGEEVEIVGLMSAPEMAKWRARCILVLPGTHSKHVRIEDQLVVNWRTYMTGELFDVLGQHSLLRASVNLAVKSTGASLAAGQEAAFQEGVRCAQKEGMAAGLFRVRTRTVLNRVPMAENTWFLSGLLIGSELIELVKVAGDCPILLAAAGDLATVYATAMKALATPATQWFQLPPSQVDTAVAAGHAVFLRAREIAT